MSFSVCLAQALQTLQPGQMPNDMQPHFLTNVYTTTDQTEKKYNNEFLKMNRDKN